MALKGYKPTQKKAPWFLAQPATVSAKPKRIRHRTSKRAAEEKLYRIEAAAFLAAAVARGETCPILFEAIKTGLKDWNYGFLIDDTVTQIHHMRGRRGSLLRDQRHWLAVSAAGHDWIERHKEEARRHGWLCEKGLFNTPDKT
jgi:hypothetical protein